MKFKFGDILLNHYAGDRNPYKKIVFIRKSSKYIECIGYDGADVNFYKTDNKIEKIGRMSDFKLKDLLEGEPDEI